MVMVMKGAIFGSLLATVAVLGQLWSPNTVQVVEGSTRSKSVHLVQGKRTINIETEEFKVKALDGSRNERLNRVLLLYQKESHLCWWNVSNAQNDESASGRPVIDGLLDSSLLYVAEDEVVNVRWLPSPPRLWIVKGRYCSSIQDARAQAVATLGDRQRLRNWSSEVSRELELWRALPDDFFQLKNSASPSEPKLRELTKSGEQWQVTLVGPNGDTAVVLLNNKFELVSAKVLPR
jgi:hypothetical protein